MRLRGSWGDSEPLADLVVRAPRGDEGDHLTLPLGDRHPPVDHCIRHARRLRPSPGYHHSPEVYPQA